MDLDEDFTDLSAWTNDEDGYRLMLSDDGNDFGSLTLHDDGVTYLDLDIWDHDWRHGAEPSKRDLYDAMRGACERARQVLAVLEPQLAAQPPAQTDGRDE